MLPSGTDRSWLRGKPIAVLAVAVVLAAGQPANAADPKPADAVSLTIDTDSRSIYADDPLLLKCVLRNNGKQDVSVFGSFDPLHATPTAGIRIEARAPDRKDFEWVRVMGYGRICFIVPRRWELKSGQGIASYPQLGCLPTPGKWQVRVRITVDDKEIVTQPVTISVARRPAEARKLLDEYGSEIYSCFALHGYIDATDLEKALLAREALAGSEAGRAITEAHLLRTLRTAGAARARTLALEDVKKHRDRLGPVAREYFDLSTAQILLDHKEYQKAKALLDAISEPSNARALMQHEIRLAEEKK